MKIRKYKDAEGQRYYEKVDNNEVVRYRRKELILDYQGKKAIELYYEWFDEDGKLHREDGPACVSFDSDGRKVTESWYKNGKLHRENALPADIYYTKGVITKESYYIEDILKRGHDKPEIVNYYESGRVKSEHFNERWTNGTGEEPARICYYGDGTISSKMFYNYRQHFKTECYKPSGEIDKIIYAEEKDEEGSIYTDEDNLIFVDFEKRTSSTKLR